MFSKVNLTFGAVMLSILKSFTAEWDPAAKPKAKDAHHNADDPSDHTSAFLSPCHTFCLAVKAVYLS